VVGARSDRKWKSRSRRRQLVDRHRDRTDRKRRSVVVDVIDEDGDENETKVTYKCGGHVELSAAGRWCTGVVVTSS